MNTFQGLWRTLLCCLVAIPIANSQPLTALHWWTSESERASEQVLSQSFADIGLHWQPVAVSGGAGEGALKVLRAKVLSGQAPDIAQIVGPSIRSWAKLGFFHTQADSSDRNGWQYALADQVLPLVSLAGEPYAIPISIHRINTLVYNRRLFEAHDLSAPATWDEFLAVLAQLEQLGIQPLAQSTQPWQLATLFEVIMASTLSGDQYEQVVLHFNQPTIMSPEMALAFERLRALQRYFYTPARPDWQASSQALYQGQAAMQIMGDWAKAELALQQETDDFALGCQPFLQSTKHLYSVDSFVIFNHVPPATAERIANQLSDPAVQAAFSQAKGTIPARQDVPVQYDECARRSYQDFHHHRPLASMVHRAANNEAARNVFIHVVNRYLADATLTPSQAQRRLANELTALTTNE